MARSSVDFDAACANGIGGNVERRRDDVVDRHRTAFGLLLPGHGEEGTHDARAALGGGANLQRRGLRGRIAMLLEQHRPRHDDRKRIVELMGNAGEQRAERGKFFALIQRFPLSRQLFRGALLLGDVASDGQHVRLSLILHRDAVHFELERGPILATVSHFRMQRFAGRYRFEKISVVEGPVSLPSGSAGDSPSP